MKIANGGIAVEYKVSHKDPTAASDCGNLPDDPRCPPSPYHLNLPSVFNNLDGGL